MIIPRKNCFKHRLIKVNRSLGIMPPEKMVKFFADFVSPNFIAGGDINLWFGKPCQPRRGDGGGPEKLVKVQKNYPELQRGPAFAAVC